ncbi:hypothetical protein EC960428_3044, partial [Escherichia coli 96.0428]
MNFQHMQLLTAVSAR